MSRKPPQANKPWKENAESVSRRARPGRSIWAASARRSTTTSMPNRRAVISSSASKTLIPNVSCPVPRPISSRVSVGAASIPTKAWTRLATWWKWLRRSIPTRPTASRSAAASTASMRKNWLRRGMPTMPSTRPRSLLRSARLPRRKRKPLPTTGRRAVSSGIR